MSAEFLAKGDRVSVVLVTRVLRWKTHLSQEFKTILGKLVKLHLKIQMSFDATVGKLLNTMERFS